MTDLLKSGRFDDKHVIVSRRGLLFALLLAFGCLAISAKVSAQDKGKPLLPENAHFVFSTDMSGDIDDAAAVGFLLEAVQEGAGALAACVADSPTESTAPALRAMLDAWGFSSVPVGAYGGDQGDSREGPYAREVADAFGQAGRTRKDFESDISVLRREYASAPDRSIVFIAVGFLNSLEGLLKSGPDEYSTLDGAALFEKKTSHVVSVGANFPGNADGETRWNWKHAPDSAAYVINHMTRPFFWLPANEIDQASFPKDHPRFGDRDALTGPEELGWNAETNPIQLAFEWKQKRQPKSLEDGLRRKAFDPAAVRFATRPDTPLFDLYHENIHVEVNGGRLKVSPDEEGVFSILRLAAPTNGNEARDYLDGILGNLAIPTVRWTLDELDENLIPDGAVKAETGVQGRSLVFAGNNVIRLRGSSGLNGEDGEFTISAWFNPYRLDVGQQMIVGKNQYSLDQRQWGILIEPDGKLRAYLRDGGWKTIDGGVPLKPGHWHQAVLTVGEKRATLYLNGRKSGSVILTKALSPSDAPVTVGGILDDGKSRQLFHGAIDEVQYDPRELDAREVESRYREIHSTHEIPEPPERFALWQESSPLSEAADLPELENVDFHVIKKWDKPGDGYTFLHGVALAWHKGKLYASIGHNKGAENTVTEEAQFRVSEDGGRNWGPLRVIDAGEEENLAVSHGVFLSHGDRLWAFHGAYFGKMEGIHTRAYSLDEATGQWTRHGEVVGDGFWAMNQPVKMADGNWIMPGGSFGPYSNDRVFPAAVAISHGDDFQKWDLVSIPVDGEIRRMWGESSLFVDGPKVYNLARYGGGAQALAAVSGDYGRSWTSSGITNLPMATSKPAAGILSTGQRYLVCTTAQNNGGRRSPLTIAVSRPGENQFSQVFVIRRSLNPGQPGESAERLSLSYPYALEHEGKLYVGYSNNGGRKGNLNSAELAVIPVSDLQVGADQP